MAMSRDLVLIPTLARPEYLSLALEHLVKAKAGREMSVWIFHDRHTDDPVKVSTALAETKKVVGEFSLLLDLRFTARKPHAYPGNTYNFLEAYKEAYAQEDVRFVYTIEDDVFVTEDFFRWHEAVQERRDYFCTIGWVMPKTHDRRHRSHIYRGTDPTEYIETTSNFASIGVCWRREKLATVVQHACVGLYTACTNNYLQRAFPGSPVPARQWTEQDGLMTRILLAAKHSLVVAWPVVARCAHVGVAGYHRRRGYEFTGLLGNRIAALREATETKQTITKFCTRQNELGDIAPLIQVPPYDTADLHVVQSLHFDGVL
jgi:hypothetical protein